jgi:hypothetical protein
MKIAASCLFLTLIGCAVESSEQVDSERQAVVVRAAPDATTWNPATHGPKDIWPTGRGIVSVRVTMSAEPERGDGATSLAVVTWNESSPGGLYRVHAGADEDAFRRASASAGATSSSSEEALGDADDGGVAANAGNLGGGTSPPQPHPHI